MKSTVGIRNLEVGCQIGVPRDERQSAQHLLIDIELETDIAAAVTSEALGDTIDYNAIVGVVGEVAGRRKYRLVEALAEEMGRQLLAAFPAVTHLRLEIKKQVSTIPADACFVRLERDG